jgi:hypothetical protein
MGWSYYGRLPLLILNIVDRQLLPASWVIIVCG